MFRRLMISAKSGPQLVPTLALPDAHPFDGFNRSTCISFDKKECACILFEINNTTMIARVTKSRRDCWQAYTR